MCWHLLRSEVMPPSRVCNRHGSRSGVRGQGSWLGSLLNIPGSDERRVVSGESSAESRQQRGGETLFSDTLPLKPETVADQRRSPEGPQTSATAAAPLG